MGQLARRHCEKLLMLSFKHCECHALLHFQTFELKISGISVPKILLSKSEVLSITSVGYLIASSLLNLEEL